MSFKSFSGSGRWYEHSSFGPKHVLLFVTTRTSCASNVTRKLHMSEIAHDCVRTEEEHVSGVRTPEEHVTGVRTDELVRIIYNSDPYIIDIFIYMYIYTHTHILFWGLYIYIYIYIYIK